MLKEDKWCMELCVSLNRFKMFDSKIDLHRNQKAIQCLNNNNNSCAAYGYGFSFNINLSLLIKVK